MRSLRAFPGVVVVLFAALACGGGNSGTGLPDHGRDLPASLDVQFDETSPETTTSACVETPDPLAGRFDEECWGNDGCKVLEPETGCACVACDGEKCVKGIFWGCSPVEDVPPADVPDAQGGDDPGTVEDPGTTEDPGAGEDPGYVDPGTVDPGVKDPGPIDPGVPDFGPSKYCTGEIQDNPKRIGEQCMDNCECESGMCYGEAYTAPYKFCTQECLGEKGCPDKDVVYKCLVFGPKHIDDFDISIMSICVPLCDTVADCQEFSGIWGYCPGTKKSTSWDGVTLAVVGTCQIASGM